MHREITSPLHKPFYKFFLGCQPESITSAFYRSKSSGLDYNLKIIPGKNPRFADYKEEYPTVLYIDNCYGVLNSFTPEPIVVHLRLDETSPGKMPKVMTLYDFWQTDRSGSVAVRVKVPEKFTVESGLSKAQAEITALQSQIADLKFHIDLLGEKVKELDAENGKLLTKLNPPAPSPPAFPTIQHDTGPWRK